MAVDNDTILRTLMQIRTRLYAYIWSIVHDEHLAEDILQDVFSLTMVKASEIRDPNMLPLWMHRSARLLSLRAIRDRSSFPASLDISVLDMLEDEWDKLDSRNTDDDMVDALRDCLEKLTPRSRKLIKMRYIDGLAGKTVAETLGLQLQSIYVSMSRIHHKLRQCIERRLKREGGVL